MKMGKSLAARINQSMSQAVENKFVIFCDDLLHFCFLSLQTEYLWNCAEEDL